MGIAMLEDASESGLEPAQVAAQSRLLQRQIDSMMASIRRIASDLRPPMLDDLGLIAAVEWLADDFTHRSHVDVTTDLQMQDIALTKFAATAIFRMVQEALTNVARHAAATEVRISMSHTDEFCSVTIDDDGRGATLDDPSRRRSFGLLGMRERARQLNGTLSIVSAPGQGFRLSIRLPINAISSDAAE
jgi:signal transduction histidine kinase